MRDKLLRDALLSALAFDLYDPVWHEDANGRFVGKELPNVGAVPIRSLPLPGTPSILLHLIEMCCDAVDAQAIIRHLEHPPQQLRSLLNQLITFGAIIPAKPRR